MDAPENWISARAAHDIGRSRRAQPTSDAEVIAVWRQLRRVSAGIEADLTVAPAAGEAARSGAFHETLAIIAGSEQRMVSMSELACRVGMSGSGLTRLIDRLAAEGLVSRRHLQRDRRVVYAVLTDEGADRERHGTPVYVHRLRRSLGGLGPHGLDALRAICARLQHDDSARRVMTATGDDGTEDRSHDHG